MNRIFNILSVFFMILIALTHFSCDNATESHQSYNVENQENREKSLEKANRYMVIQENEAINDYIERHEMNVVETGTGLRYRIVNQGDTEQIKKGNIVSLDYEVRLINGNIVYSSEKSGQKVFVVGKGGVESGLEEAILHLHRGDVADIIIPSHLAHGLLGDGNLIPPRATLIYKVKIVEVQ